MTEVPRGPHLRLFGTPTLVVPPHPPRILDRVEAAVFAILALDGPAAPRPLAALVWEGSRARDPTNNLRDLRRKLRLALGRECLDIDTGVGLSPGLTHDLQVLDGDGPAPLALPDGEFLAGCEFADRPRLQHWLQEARRRAGLRRRAATGHALQRLVDERRFDEALALAERLVRDEPLVEDHHRRLAAVHQARGDRPGALAALDRARVLLAQGLGVEPGPALQRLEAEIRGQGRLPTVAPPPPPSWRQGLPLIGRDAELRRLDVAWDAGLVAVLEGEAGIGKSRLLAAFCQRHPDARYVKCMAGDAQRPFGLLARVVEALPDAALVRGADEVRGELARLVPALGPPSDKPPYAPRLARALRQALDASRAHGTRGLVVDDLHLADAGSLELLLQLAADTEVGGTQWVLAARPTAPGAHLTAWTAAHDGARVHLVLRGWSAPDIQACLARLDFAPAAAAAWAQALHRQGLTNPRHLRERLASIWADTGAAMLVDAAPDPKTWPPSQGLQDLVSSRLAALGDEARALARVAALAAGDFGPTLAEQVLDQHAARLAAPWAEVEAAGLLQGGVIADDLLREAITASIPTALARRLHAQLADAGPAVGMAPARIAEHRLAAGQPAEAGRAYVEAARQFQAARAPADELRFWDAAVAAFDQAVPQGAAAFDARASAVLPALNVETLPSVHERARALLDLAQDGPQQAAAHLALARVARQRNDLEASIHHAREGLERALATGDDGTDLVNCSAGLLVAALSLARRPQEAEPAAALLRSLDASRLAYREALDLHNALATQAAMSGDPVTGKACVRRTLALARQADDWSETVIHALNLASMQALSGEVRDALASVHEAEDAGRKLGRLQGPMASVGQMWKGNLLRQSGRFDEALTLLQQTAHDLRTAGATAWAVTTEAVLARTLGAVGDFEGARAALQTVPDPSTPAAGSRLVAELQLALDADADPPCDPKTLLSLDRGGFLETNILVALLAARMVPAAVGVAAVERLWPAAQGTRHAGLVQCARLAQVELLLGAARDDEAARVADALLGDLDRHQPMPAYLPEVWLLAYRAYACVGRVDDADAALAKGLAWVRRAFETVPEHCQPAFRRDQRVNGALFRASAQGRQAAGVSRQAAGVSATDRPRCAPPPRTPRPPRAS